MNITVNPEKRLYVLTTVRGGVSCHGFDVVKQEALAMAGRMSIKLDLPPDGSVELYQTYKELLEKFSNHLSNRHTWYHPGTDRKLIAALNAAYKDKSLVRVFYGDRETGRDWCEEFDVVGFIGRSTGTFKVPLLLEALRADAYRIESASFGGAINSSSIVRVVDVLSQAELYRHRNYKAPAFQVKGTGEDLRKMGYFFCAQRTDTGDAAITVANFKTEGEAYEYVAFMHGSCLGQPLRTRAQATADCEF